MNAVFDWNDSFLTGLAKIDEQHKRLVDLVNDVGELALGKKDIDPESLRRACVAMVDYAKIHFRDEEELMLAGRVDQRHVREHVLQHRQFFDEASHLHGLHGVVSAEQVRQLLGYLVDWLAYHILGIDQSMARQIRAIEKGLTPSEAFAAESKNVHDGTEPLLVALKGLFQTVSERNRELRAVNTTLEEKVRERTRELEEANRQLQVLAVQDELTGLPNRRYALSAIEKLWSEAGRDKTPLSILMLDADRFKEVNDTYGHAEGDALLRLLAVCLRESVRTNDIVCRLGGDEFLIICPRCSREDAGLVAEKILNADKKYCTADGVECWSGAVSIGIAQARDDMQRPEELLKAADSALYQAKARGGAQYAVQ